MIRYSLLLGLLLVSLSGNIFSATPGSELLASLHARVTQGKDLRDVFDAIEELENDEQKSLFKLVDKAWPKARDKYFANFERAAKASSGKASDQKSKIKKLRSELAAMKGLADGPMKAALKKRGMPILEELRSLLMPQVKTVMASADPSVQMDRKMIIAVAQFRDALIESAIIPITISSRSEIDTGESKITEKLSGLDRKGLKIMEKNRKIAEKKELPEPELRGVNDTNIMRLLAGYNALELDVKLCEAARDHSKDMATLGFFAHNSPVKGKRTPWDRAKNFGTTASGENIYAGSPDPLAANRGWFYSPGHHRNMFGGHRRIGHGRHNGHWTQLFGG